jgi:2-dehydro-3-deoxyphosphogluconate aldolase / (4S)-4-hydroxy-2-oxoglutarate aldolase
LSKPSALAALGGNRIIPVVVIDDPQSAVKVATALIRGGITCAEVTLRTPNALACLRAMAEVEGFLAGAGTVLNAMHVSAAVSEGARFLVSPGFDDEVLAAATRAGVQAILGVATATEAQRAVKAGVTTVKFFPATAAGGLAMVKALSGPFPQLTFVPTGGITQADAPVWLRSPCVVAVGGSWLTPPELIAAGRYDSIEVIARDTIAAVREAENWS